MSKLMLLTPKFWVNEIIKDAVDRLVSNMLVFQLTDLLDNQKHALKSYFVKTGQTGASRSCQLKFLWSFSAQTSVLILKWMKSVVGFRIWTSVNWVNIAYNTEIEEEKMKKLEKKLSRRSYFAYLGLKTTFPTWKAKVKKILEIWLVSGVRARDRRELFGFTHVSNHNGQGLCFYGREAFGSLFISHHWRCCG